ncbi:MAG: aldehyde dehydrogenase family protein [Francisellaceae bacterium]|jgi:acyl-CoA reductase-like NAD-dependent aldehyde dehydrogenase|nr:aldehyde dehydrogenase family protein [Francisellaceae bacterium]MBT6207105.1 aldehyde dehydrogenase family protein [Francisellaceae bacterium]MBT6538990.1 aldehyde dehydrogenase family protein [Francisellaceae bacterium]
MTKNFDVITPIDGSVYATRAYAGNAEIQKAITLAKATQQDWQMQSVEQRSLVLNKFVNIMSENASTIATELAWQMGRPINQGPLEIKGLAQRAEYMIESAEEALSWTKVDEQRHIERRPKGIILVIAPWNYPYLTAINSIIPALMAGNMVILKHASQTPLCAEQMHKAFQQAGLPEGAFQYLHLDHDSCEELITKKMVDFVVFTGSVDIGRKVYQYCANALIGCALELGGKDPAYVCSSANISQAIDGLVDGAFFNSGQSCCGIERIYVHKEIHNDFLEAFIAKTKDYNLGNPLEHNIDLGPMASLSGAQNVQNMVAEAILQGAQSLLKVSSNLPYFSPQILTKVTQNMPIQQEEIFGPVVTISSVDNDQQALEYMNDSKFGLTASIWSEDKQHAFKLAQHLDAGTCFLNRCDYLDPALPWSGVKDSGLGYSLSKLGYDQLTRPRAFLLGE